MTTLAEIAAYQPQDIDEALDAMRSALDHFHRENDQRAIFLRAYYLITIAVHQAICQHGRYTNRIFFDAAWIKRLAGKFSTLYFRSLTTEERPGERAWKLAHRLAAGNETPVLQDMVLGLNAHINYDLAYGIYLNLREHGDEGEVVPGRKFDHDQVNNVLVNCIPQVEEVLMRDYGGKARVLGDLVGNLDEAVSGIGLKYYRERVWWNSMAFLAAQGDDQIALVRARLDWESAQLAESIAFEGTVLQRSLRGLFNLFSKETFGPIELEREDADAPPSRRKPGQAISPF